MTLWKEDLKSFCKMKGLKRADRGGEIPIISNILSMGEKVESFNNIEEDILCLFISCKAINEPICFVLDEELRSSLT